MKNIQWLYHLGKLSLIGIFLIVHSTPVLGQNDTIHVTGTIKDANGPLLGVNIQIKGKSLGTTSDSDGRYAITVSNSDILVFSFVGYVTREVSVDGSVLIDILMEPDITELGEVMLNAGYYKTTVKEKTGNIVKVTSQELETQPVNSPLEALQGRMPGVQITQNSGIQGGGFRVRIRGQNSLAAGNDPLYIIDGVPYDSGTLSYPGASAGVIPLGEVSPLNAIPPASIASVEVLKDADATAIYGARGANGVVLITTKSGTAGKTDVFLNVRSGIANITLKKDLMNTSQYLQMRREAYVNDGITDYPYNAYDLNGTWSTDRDTDWQEVLTGGTAFIQNYQGGISGGDRATTFLIAGSYDRETTVFPGDFKYQRGSTLTNLHHSSSDNRLSVFLSVNFSSEKNNLPAIDPSFKSLTLPPNAPELYDASGKPNWENGTWTNPIAQLESQYTAVTNTLVGNTTLSYEILRGITLSTSMGYNNTRVKENTISPHTIYNPNWGLTSAQSYMFDNQGNRHSWIVEPKLTWKFHMGKSRFQTIIGGTFQDQGGDRLSIYASGFSNNKLIYNISAASRLYILDESKNQYRYQSMFGRIQYSLNNIYFLNLTGRRDGSSRFGPGKRYSNFGSVGAGWIFSREKGINRSLPWLSFGKLRGSYGTTGNDQIGDYQYLNTYSVSDNSYNGVSGLIPSRLLNPDFAWEVNKKLETALELGLWKDALMVTISHYRNTSSNQLVGTPLPGTTGFTSIQANLPATVLNTGWEFDINTLLIHGKHLNWSSTFNLTLPRNKLTAFPGLEDSTYSDMYVIGKPLNITKRYHYQGVDPDTGIFMFEDYNSDGVISAPEDRQYVVDLSPSYYGGFTNKISCKNWEFVVFFTFTKQNTYNDFNARYPAGSMLNQPAVVTDRWQQPGDRSVYQRYTTGNNVSAVEAYNHFQYSNRTISKSFYARLKNISISYNMPEGILGSEDCSFSLQAQNLLTFSNNLSGDPEQQLGYIPLLRRITLGTKFNF